MENKNIVEDNIIEKNYWHIQMQYPNGERGLIIDSIKMLEDKNPIIAMMEMDNTQFKNFKNEDGTGLRVGDIILIREEDMILALCEIKGECFQDPVLTKKYRHWNFRYVRILDWYQGYEKFPQPQGILSKLSTRKTKSYKFVDNWYKKLNPPLNPDNNIQL